MTKSVAMFLLLMAACCQTFAQNRARLTNLPTLYIETEGREPVTSKQQYINATLWYINERDEVAMFDSVLIRGRGNSTWTLPKKPYRIKFQRKTSFLGDNYAKAKSWTLLANAADKTLMRNAVTSAMSRFTSLPFSPAAKFVDLVFNGSYQGNYQISDQVEVREKRVEVTEQDLPLTAASNITGGYLLEVDEIAQIKGNYFKTKRYHATVKIHYPDEDDITPAQNSYIQDYIDQFEQKLFSSSFAHPEDGYRPMVDSLSLADWYIGTEVSANFDGFFSTYFYKEQNDKRLHWGPMWDYDIAYDNDLRIPHSVNQLMREVALNGSRAWFVRMSRDKWFQQLVNRRFHELLEQGLRQHLQNTVDSLANLLDASQQLNYQLWDIDKRTYHENRLHLDYADYVTDLKDFIDSRLNFLSKAFAKKSDSREDEWQPEAIYVHDICGIFIGKYPPQLEEVLEQLPHGFYMIRKVGRNREESIKYIK